MPYFEVEPQKSFGPYSATIGAEENFDYGQIRVEPPVILTEDFLKAVEDYGFSLEHEMTDNQSTVITFFGKVGERLDHTSTENKAMIKDVSIELLNRLGAMSSKDLFIKKWREE